MIDRELGAWERLTRRGLRTAERVVLGLPEGGRRYRALLRRATAQPHRIGVLRQTPPRPLVLSPPAPRPGGGGPLPSLSIVTPSYQQARYLRATLESVLGQGYPGLEYLVLDGGSTDGSAELIRAYADRLAYWTSARDGGQAAAVAAGLARSTGEVLGWLNSDDVYAPGTLRLVGELFARRPDVDAIYGDRVLIDDEDREIGRWVLPAHDDELLRWVDYVPQETLFFRRSAYERVGGIDPAFAFALDWDLLLRMQRGGARFLRVPRPLGCFRVHAEHKTSTALATVGAAEIERLRRRELGAGYDPAEVARRYERMEMRSYLHVVAERLGLSRQE